MHMIQGCMESIRHALSSLQGAGGLFGAQQRLIMHHNAGLLGAWRLRFSKARAAMAGRLEAADDRGSWARLLRQCIPHCVALNSACCPGSSCSVDDTGNAALLSNEPGEQGLGKVKS